MAVPKKLTSYSIKISHFATWLNNPNKHAQYAFSLANLILKNMYIYLYRGRYIFKIGFCHLSNFMKSFKLVKTLLKLYSIYLWILRIYLIIVMHLLIIYSTD